MILRAWHSNIGLRAPDRNSLYTGRDIDNPDRPETEHFGNCPICGALLDMCDLGQVFEHLHGEEIEFLDHAVRTRTEMPRPNKLSYPSGRLGFWLPSAP